MSERTRGLGQGHERPFLPARDWQVSVSSDDDSDSEIEVEVIPRPRPSSPSPSADHLRGQMISDLAKMLESGDGADVEINVPKETGGKVDKASYTKKVHKGILMSRSTVFAKMFAKDSKMVEALSGKVVIKDMSPKGLDIFLHYLYTGEVLQQWVQVFEEIINAADKYDCGKLKQYCGHNLPSVVTTANALKMYEVAKLHNLSFAVKGIMEFIHRNAMTVITEEVLDKVVGKVGQQRE